MPLSANKKKNIFRAGNGRFDDGNTIRRFFQKRYMDSYRQVRLFFHKKSTLINSKNSRKGLNFSETTFSIRKYKSHHRIPEAEEVR